MRRLVYVLAALGMSVPVIAWAQVMCGDTVTQSTDLTSDILGCGIDPAVEVVGPAVLRMNGFSISCTSTADPPAGIDAGVLLTGRGAKLLGPGTITNCHNGVVLEGAGKHVVTDVTAEANDDGIEVRSPDSKLINNIVTLNGDEGFDVEAGGNKFIGNQIIDNVDKGLVINTGVGNHIIQNIISGSGDDGIEIEEDGSETLIVGNDVNNNGERGIELDESDGNMIRNNDVTDNGIVLAPGDAQGIRVRSGAENNQIVNNRVFGHDTDIEDENFDCDNNRYMANRFGSADPSTCIR